MKRLRSGVLVLTAVLLLCPSILHAQEKAVVYVWKTWHPSTLGRAAFDVFLDEKPIAKLDRGRYFVALLAPGKHAFRTKTREAGAIELDFRPGQGYYLRMDTTTGLLIGRPVLTHVAEEEGRAAIKQAKSIKADDIRDRSIVVMDYSTAQLPSRQKPQAEVQKVAVQITSEPEGAEVFLDGDFAGSTPSRLVVSVGPHVLKVARPGYNDWERKVLVEVGSAMSFNAILMKREGPQ